MTTSQTQLDFQECGLQNFDKDSDVLIVAPEINVPEDVVTIRVKGIRKPVILKTYGYSYKSPGYFNFDFD